MLQKQLGLHTFLILFPISLQHEISITIYIYIMETLGDLFKYFIFCIFHDENWRNSFLSDEYEY